MEEEKPLVIIGSPPCTPFSQLQTLNPATDKSREKWAEGVDHMRFVVSLYRTQIRNGRVFLHEHPKNAKSWMLEEIRRLQKRECR